MKNKDKVIYALYNDDDILMDAIKVIRQKKVRIKNVYTPFPVHGLDKAVGLKPTKMAITSFIYGVLGLGVGIWLTYYTMVYDWPQDIGGKPSMTYLENMPAFVPILFEITVFFAAHLMVLTFLFRSKLFPGQKSTSPSLRTTDDMFAVELWVSNNEDELKELFLSTGAVEVHMLNEDQPKTIES